jgi:imidazolonepropionase-like amidohydrolase
MATTVITNVLVFDGKDSQGLNNVVFSDDTITALIPLGAGVENNGEAVATVGADDSLVIDGSGCSLLPGLIDSHAHLYDRVDDLYTCAKNGVTTMLDMGNRDYRIAKKLRSVPGAASVFSVLAVAFAPDSSMCKAMYYTDDCIIKDNFDAERFVSEQERHEADFIKIVFEDPAQGNGVIWPPDLAKALVDKAHQSGKLVIAHAVTADSYLAALQSGVDEISHVPFQPLTEHVIGEVVSRGIAIAPTLTMMYAIAQKLHENFGLPNMANICLQNLAKLRHAGVSLLVATDANFDDPPSLATPMAYGSTMHRELGYFVQAGFSPSEALASATSLAADFFGLEDRGRIAVGKRADLYLVKGNPTSNIADICNTEKVWVAGVGVKL